LQSEVELINGLEERKVSLTGASLPELVGMADKLKSIT